MMPVSSLCTVLSNVQLPSMGQSLKELFLLLVNYVHHLGNKKDIYRAIKQVGLAFML